VIVVDTHAWLWWTVAPQRLSRRARRAIDGAEKVGVSTMSAFEVVLLEHARRIRLDVPVRSWVREALARTPVEALPVTTEIALDAAQLAFEGDPFDRIIYATARAEDAQLVTRDQRLHGFDPDRTVW
jgi:PIN domain nuclease of toxin-antitoxin system